MKQINQVLVLYIVFCSLAGCASTPSNDDIFQTYLTGQNCQDALDWADNNFDNYAFYLRYGIVEAQCRGNLPKAIEIWTTAAKLGCERCAEELEKVGVKPPVVKKPPLPPIQVY